MKKSVLRVDWKVGNDFWRLKWERERCGWKGGNL